MGDAKRHGRNYAFKSTQCMCSPAHSLDGCLGRIFLNGAQSPRITASGKFQAYRIRLQPRVNSMRNRILCLATVLALNCGLFAAPVPSGGYSVIKKIPIEGKGGWDYLAIDDVARRLYVSHGTAVEILNLDSGERLGAIPTVGVHGIALAPEFNHGFISDGKANAVLMFDLKTMKVLAKIASPKDPDGIIYDAASKRIFAFNGDSNSATVIDAATGKVAGTVDLGGGPEFAAADGNGSAFNNLEDENLVVKINSSALKVEQRWPTAP